MVDRVDKVIDLTNDRLYTKVADKGEGEVRRTRKMPAECGIFFSSLCQSGPQEKKNQMTQQVPVSRYVPMYLRFKLPLACLCNIDD